MTPRSDDTGAVDVGPAADSADLEQVAAKFGLRCVHSVAADMLDSTLVADLPVEWARSHCLLPVRIDGELCVLTADPSRIADHEYVALLLGVELHPVVASRQVILKSIEQCYFSRRDTAEAFIREMDGSKGGVGGLLAAGGEDLLQVSEQAPITQLVNIILLEALKSRASDIHFEPFEARLRVRFRIDGRLYEQAAPPKHVEQALVSRLKVMAHMDIAEKRLPQDGMARVRVGEREIDVRVSTVPVAEGERVVLRLLDRDSALLPLADLGMSAGVLESFRGLLAQTYGLILVTGPTGSGKTTTLYAALGEVECDEMNIMTIEEPIEYQLAGIGQIQVKPKIGLTFASGLRYILRQDPDVILVGETRDLETAETAVRSSLTGHLVLTTLHTNDAASAVVRLVDMGIEPYLLASSLRGAMAQRLVRRLCPLCRRAAVASAADVEGLGAAGRRLAKQSIREAAGCASCLGGYKGRTGIYELMTVDQEIQEQIRRGRVNLSDLAQAACGKGMTSLLEDGVEKVLAGATSVGEVMRTLGRTYAGSTTS